MIATQEQVTSIASYPARIASCEAALRLAGAICTFVSPSGSKYFDLQDGSRVRVSDHPANAPFGSFEKDDRWAAEIRVDAPTWAEKLLAVAGKPESKAIELPPSIYFADHACISQSMLKVFADRRRKYEGYFVKHNMDEPPDTDPMRKGTATHTALLEPHRFDRIVITYPANILAKKDGKESPDGAVSTTAAKTFRDEHEANGRIALKEKDAAIVRTMADSVRSVCGDWLDYPGEKEKALYWTDEFTGLRLKMRLDWLVKSEGLVCFDLKTTADASPSEFKRTCERQLYALQAAQYIDGIEQCYGETPEFYFIAVESAPPFACAIHELDAGSLADARSYRHRLLKDLRACIDSGNFAEPWERRINTISLNPYRYAQE